MGDGLYTIEGALMSGREACRRLVTRHEMSDAKGKNAVTRNVTVLVKRNGIVEVFVDDEHRATVDLFGGAP